MKKILSLLLVCMCAFGAFAAEKTFTASADLVDGTVDGFTFHAEKNNGSTQPTYNTNGQDVRIYAKGTYTITNNSGTNMTNIVFYISAQGKKRLAAITPNTGAVAAQAVGDATVTWNGASQAVSFTVGDQAVYGTEGESKAGQLCFTSIVITYEDGGTVTIPAPTFNPAGGTFYAPINVSITASTGATIYYTTNGNDPTTSSTVYSEPIPVSQNTTLKAIAVTEAATSAVAEATYTFESVTTVDNIAAYYALGAGAFAAIANPVTVYYRNGNYVWVKDETGYLLIYGRNAGNMGYVNGDIIPGGFGGYLKEYNGLLEMSYQDDYDLFGFQEATAGPAVNPETATTADVVGANFGHYVTIENATITDIDGKNFTVNDAAGTAAGYNQYSGISLPTDGGTYNITGIISVITKDGVTTYQLQPTAIEMDPSNYPKVDNIAAYAALEDNTVAMFNNPVNVTFANGKNVYVRDATGYMCIFGDEVNGMYNNGDVIPAGFSGKKTIYNTGLEMQAPLTGFVAATSTTTVDPEEITFANFSTQPMWKYVILRDALITNVSGKNVTLKDANGSTTVAGYNQYGITIPNDHSIPYDVIGIVTSYQNNLQLYLVEIVDDTPLSTYVDDIDGLLALEQGKNAIFSNPVTVAYHSGNQLYIKDGNDDFMLVYGHLNNTYNNGDVLTGIAGSWTIYNGMTEMVPLADYFTEATAGTPVEPETLAIEEISQDLIHHYLRMENCTITPIEGDNRNFTLTDETGDMIMRLNFTEVTIAEDFDFTAEYNVEGFLAYYKKSDGTVEQLQFYPNLIQKVGDVNPPVPGDVDGDGFVTAGDITLLYNVMLNNDYSGVVNGDQDGDGNITAGDVTFIYNILLGN